MKSNTSFPRWLSASFGIGADGMIGARTNPSKIGDVVIPEFKRTQKYLFSIDADLKRIDNKQMDQRLLLSVPNILKMPAPTITFMKDVPVKFNWLYF